jgi:opacity protein-like surface antigen
VAARAGIVTALVCALLSAAAASAAAPPSEAVYRKLCRAIRTPHVRGLFTAPLAPIHLGGTSDCSFSTKGGNGLVDGIQVFLRIDDGDRTLWKHRGDHPYGAFRALTGAGQQAKWGYQGGRVPSVVDARSGTFTCTLIPGDDASKFALTRGPALTSARTFAQHLLRICADVFTAYRSG